VRDDPAASEDRPPVTLSRAIRGSFASYQDEIVLFLMVNIALVLIVAVFVAATAVVPPLLLLSPLLALPAAVLMRLAVAAARDSAPTWAMAWTELGRNAGRKVGLAAVQLLVMGVSVANLSLAPGIGGIPGILSALVGGYALIATSVYAVALWPILSDPLRDGPVRHQLRLAVAAVLVRPIQLAVLMVITLLAAYASVQLIAPAIFLPSLVMLAIAAYVVDTIDRLRPRES
jgi:hypothetical protein